jgi:hypothetical protein
MANAKRVRFGMICYYGVTYPTFTYIVKIKHMHIIDNRFINSC